MRLLTYFQQITVIFFDFRDSRSRYGLYIWWPNAAVISDRLPTTLAVSSSHKYGTINASGLKKTMDNRGH